MDTNAIIIDAVTTLLTAFLTVTVVALLPYLQARRKEREEKNLLKIEGETKKIVVGAEVLEKMTGAFGSIQDFYAEALEVSNAKVAELREEIKQLKKLEGQFARMELLTEQVVDLTDQLIVMRKTIRDYKKREQKLKELVVVLSNQLKRLKEEPEVTLEDLDEEGAKE